LNIHLNPDVLAHAPEILAAFRELTSLRINSSHIDSSILESYLPNLPRLKYLDLTRLRFPIPHFHVYAPQLTALRINHDGTDVFPLIQLHRVTTLRVLHVVCHPHAVIAPVRDLFSTQSLLFPQLTEARVFAPNQGIPVWPPLESVDDE
jgi:hypothetical protein